MPLFCSSKSCVIKLRLKIKSNTSEIEFDYLTLCNIEVLLDTETFKYEILYCIIWERKLPEAFAWYEIKHLTIELQCIRQSNYQATSKHFSGTVPNWQATYFLIAKILVYCRKIFKDQTLFQVRYKGEKRLPGFDNVGASYVCLPEYRLMER